MKTTNYYDTFIAVAEDCPVGAAEVPRQRSEEKTVASIEYELLTDHPYVYTSDDVLFHVYARRKNIADGGLRSEREIFFSKGQPCLRSSPLTKRYGWGVHSNHEGKVALYAMDSNEYRQFVDDENVKQLKAMRSMRAR